MWRPVNGAVATIAAEYSEIHKKSFAILAADAAEINFELVNESAQLNKYRRSVQFYSNAPCERLPFEDGSVDLICSQFGIEYSELSKSIPEVKRALKADGRFAAVMHHKMSSVVRGASRELESTKDALYKQKAFERLDQYFNALGEVPDEASLCIARNKPVAIKSAAQIDKMFQYLRSRYPGSQAAGKIMEEINRLASQFACKTPAERSSIVKTAHEDMEMTIYRQNDLQQAALSPRAMENACRIAKSAGFAEFAYHPVTSPDGMIMGWLVNAAA